MTDQNDRRPIYSDEFIASMEAKLRNPKGSADYDRRAWWLGEGRAEAARQRNIDVAELTSYAGERSTLSRVLLAPVSVPRAAILAVFVVGLLAGLYLSRDDTTAPAPRRAAPSRRRLRR